MKMAICIFLASALFLSFLPPHSSNAEMMTETSQITLSGKIGHPKSDKVYLKYYADFVSHDIVVTDSAILDKDGNFTMIFESQRNCLYWFCHGKEDAYMYLFPDDSLHLTVDAKKFEESIQYTGRGSEINNYLAWKDKNTPMKSSRAMFMMTEKEFTTQLDSERVKSLAALDKWFSGKTNDAPVANFKMYEKAQIDYSWADWRLSYPIGFKYFNQLKYAPALSENYYDFLKSTQIKDEMALNSPNYLRFISNYADHEIGKLKALDSTSDVNVLKQKYIDEHFTGVIKEHLYNEWIYRTLTSNNDAILGKRLLESYKTFSKDLYWLNMLEQKILKAETLAPGKPAPEFTFHDTKGENVSLKDFRGKVVYLDIWATWCGPCLMEIPAALKLHEEMKGKDIVFLSVSVDNDEKAWKKMVKSKKLPGVQLISTGGFQSEIAKLYNVKGIPSYFIIGKDGLIVDNDAERPSGNVKQDLEKLLN
jgi:peroxiredoxin